MSLQTIEDWFLAVEAGNQAVVAGYLPRFKRSLNAGGMTALMVAARMGSAELVSLLVHDEQGMKDMEGRTALMHAVHHHQPSVCRLLAEYEVDDSHLGGHSILSTLVNYNDLECLEEVLRGIGPAKVHDSPLLVAVTMDRLHCIQLLLKYNQCFHRSDYEDACALADDLGFKAVHEELLAWQSKIDEVVARAVARHSSANNVKQLPADHRGSIEKHSVDILELKHTFNARLDFFMAENVDLQTKLKNTEADNERLHVELTDLELKCRHMEDSIAQLNEDKVFLNNSVQTLQNDVAALKRNLEESKQQACALAEQLCDEKKNTTELTENLQLIAITPDELLPADIVDVVGSTGLQLARTCALKNDAFLFVRRMFGEPSACDQRHAAGASPGPQDQGPERKVLSANQSPHRGAVYHRNNGVRRKKSHHGK